MEKEKNTKEKTSVFLIEDDEFLRELLVHKLKNEGFEINWASDGENALKDIKEIKPEIVLLDLILPGMGGFDVLKEIKKDERTKDIPVVIVSNLGQKEEVEKGMELGAKDYMIKANFTPKDIIQKIYEVLDK